MQSYLRTITLNNQWLFESVVNIYLIVSKVLTVPIIYRHLWQLTNWKRLITHIKNYQLLFELITNIYLIV